MIERMANSNICLKINKRVEFNTIKYGLYKVFDFNIS